MSKILTLGEIMLRLSTDPGTLMTYSTNFTGHYGGGEANVGISLANFGHEVAFASKVPANPLGVAVRKHLKSYGICTALLRKGGERLGTYYLESGVGERAASVVYDRAHSSFSSMEALEWDF
ncbi:MAG: PfkB family carbohydrate kinase, partial [Trichococcus flocculiformis]